MNLAMNYTRKTLDSEDNGHTGCLNVSHCQQQTCIEPGWPYSVFDLTYIKWLNEWIKFEYAKQFTWNESVLIQFFKVKIDYTVEPATLPIPT